MSVLIEGIEMPKNCDECFILHSCKLWMSMTVRQRIECKHPDCPVIEIKTPHGRLNDADELEKGFKRAIGTYLPKDPTRHMNIVDGSECRGWTQAFTAVQKAKTVIEAEGETE